MLAIKYLVAQHLTRSLVRPRKYSVIYLETEEA